MPLKAAFTMVTHQPAWFRKADKHMRRSLIGLAITVTTLTTAALTALLAAAPASAAPNQVRHDHFNGTFAEAVWFNSASDAGLYIRASQAKTSNSLAVDEVIQTRDAQGNVTGTTETFADVTSGYSFSIDAVKLTTASIAGTGLPATTCTFNENFDLVGCSPSVLNAEATWTGQGLITHNTNNSRVRAGGFSVNEHLNGTNRDGTATALVNGIAFSTSDSEFAILGQAVSGTTTLCLGGNC
jgi:hypothetical protein